MQLDDLALKGARHHSFTQSFNAVHLGLHQASPVVANPALPDASTQPPARVKRSIAIPKHSPLAGSSILAGRNDGHGAVPDDRFVGRLCVVGTIASKALERFIWR